MKRFLFFASLLLSLSVTASAQFSSSPVFRNAGVLSGACPATKIGLNTLTGIVYTCQSGNWAAIGTFTGGTLTSALLFSPDSTLDIGANGANRPLRIWVAQTVQANSEVKSQSLAAGLSGQTKMTGPSDGVLQLTNNAGTDFTRIQFGGATASFPAITKSSTRVQFKLADGSDFTNIQIGSTAAKPTCDSTVRGTIYHFYGGAGVKDTVEVCAKDVADAYAWRTIY